MSKSKTFSGKLLGLLLAIAAIIFLIPALSFDTAAATDPPFSNLMADNYLYGDGWTWNGQTLHFYGSRSFDLNYINFNIKSTKNGEAAVIDIASSISVTGSAAFVDADVPLKICGAGKIDATNTSTLFSAPSIEYAGGAIISSTNTSIFDCDELTITQGYIEAVNSVFFAQKTEVKNSYVVIDGFKSRRNENLTVKIDRSYVETTTLLSGTSLYPRSTPTYTLVDSVLSSKATVDEFFASRNPYFESVKDSVVYLPELQNIGWLGTDALSKAPVNRKVTSGGYVFCNKVLTDDDRTGNTDLNGNTASVGTELSGVFFDSNQSSTRALNLTNVKLTGGNLFICPNNLTANTNVQAENATLAFVSNGYNRDVDLCGYSKASFKSCTIASTNDNTAECHISIDAPYTDNCYIYSNAVDLNDNRSIYVSCDYNIKTENNFYAPNGNINIRPQVDNIYANICAKKLKNLAYTFVFHGNVYADSLVYSEGCVFDGSGDYEVSLLSSDNGVEFDSPLIYVHEKSGSDWVYTEIQPDTNGSIKYTGTNEIYAGGMVLNPIAGNPVFSNPMKVSMGSPATVKVPLTYPFSNGTLDLDISLFDEDGNYILNWSDIGVDLKIPNTGGEKELTLSLEANSGAKEGTYFFYLNINGQNVKADSTSEIFFKVKVDYVKVSFYHEGDYDYPATDCYTVSAEYNGSPLVMQGTGVDSYYLVPLGESFDITIIPNDGYMFEDIRYGTGSDYSNWKKIDISPNGKYHLAASGDETIYLLIYPTYNQQYVEVDISDELRKSLADGEISSVTVGFANGMEETFDASADLFPIKVKNDSKVKVTVTTTEDYSAATINGAVPDYNSADGTYSTDITIEGNTTITAEIGKTSELCSLDLIIINISNPGDKVIVKNTPVNSLGQYKIGTECELVAVVTEDKFIGTVDFNGVPIETYSMESDGCHFKVTLAAGVNEFVLYYSDLSILRIPKPANGSVVFSGRLDGGRSFTTSADGTQVYNIGSWEDVTLTLVPDAGYKLKSAALNGNAVTVVNNTYTLTTEQLTDWTFTAEFAEIPAGDVTLTVISGEGGTVTPATSSYPVGSQVTLTVTPNTGYQVKAVTLDGAAVTLTNGKYTFTVNADCVFKAEFEAVPANSVLVTVEAGIGGTVTPTTSSYPVGSQVTLTVVPDSGYYVRTATLNGTPVSLSGNRYTFTAEADCIFSVEFARVQYPNGNGGNSGSGSSGGSSNPALNGAAKSWSEIASEIAKMPLESVITIDLNGSMTVPADVIRAIRDRNITAAFNVDEAKSWTVNGAEIATVGAAELGIYTGASSVQGARGSAALRFSVKNTGINALLNVKLNAKNAGMFANLYSIANGKAEFAGTAKIGKDGSVTLSGANVKGEYVIMVGEYSDLLGDADNDGALNALDASAILRHIVGIEDAENPLMADFNGDGIINALDASAILKMLTA